MPGTPEWNRVPHLGRPERLELAAGKLARPVLRGRDGSNVVLLPDARTPAGYVPILSEYDQQTLRGGRFLPELRVAYGEGVVAEILRRVRGTARRVVEGQLVKIRVHY